jgi:hypothetical protein
MDKQDSLKNNGRSYDATSRTAFIDAVEWAGERMAAQLRGYVSFNERGPVNIFIRARKYSPFLCMSRLQAEVNNLRLSSRISYITNGSASEEDLGNLIFNLDEIADQYPDKKSFDYDEILR